jgi:hypothetical protein
VAAAVVILATAVSSCLFHTLEDASQVKLQLLAAPPAAHWISLPVYTTTSSSTPQHWCGSTGCSCSRTAAAFATQTTETCCHFRKYLIAAFAAAPHHITPQLLPPPPPLLPPLPPPPPPPLLLLLLLPPLLTTYTTP